MSFLMSAAIAVLDGELEAVVTGVEGAELAEAVLDGELEAVVTGVEEAELAEAVLLVVLEEVDGALEAVVTGVEGDIGVFLRVARSDL